MAMTPSSTDELLIEQRDHIVIMTLNRPDRLNAISRAMLSELSVKMTEANKDPDVRCVVLTGAGMAPVVDTGHPRQRTDVMTARPTGGQR